MDHSALTEALRQTPADEAAAAARAILPQLGCRVVREATRDTWFVVNQSDEDLATIPVQMQDDRAVRRVQVNGETATFTMYADRLLVVEPQRPLRRGAGTLVVVQWR